MKNWYEFKHRVENDENIPSWVKDFVDNFEPGPTPIADAIERFRHSFEERFGEEGSEVMKFDFENLVFTGDDGVTEILEFTAKEGN